MIPLQSEYHQILRHARAYLRIDNNNQPSLSATEATISLINLWIAQIVQKQRSIPSENPHACHHQGFLVPNTKRNLHYSPTPPKIPQAPTPAPRQSPPNSRRQPRNLQGAAMPHRRRTEARFRAHLAGREGGRGRHGEPTRGRDRLRHFYSIRPSFRTRIQTGIGGWGRKLGNRGKK